MRPVVLTTFAGIVSVKMLLDIIITAVRVVAVA